MIEALIKKAERLDPLTTSDGQLLAQEIRRLQIAVKGLSILQEQTSGILDSLAGMSSNVNDLTERVEAATTKHEGEPQG